MQGYKSRLHLGVMICASLVDRQTDTQTDSFLLVILLAEQAMLKNHCIESDVYITVCRHYKTRDILLA